jgi:multidrug resistance efflux pump
MEFLKKKKKILYAGCVFFVIMFLCTLLSKGIYGASLPQVETEKPEKRALGHMVEAEGMVTANREVAVDTVSGLKVNQIYVNLGDSVSANTLLFDVDQEDLKEKISEQELAIKKLEMSNEQARQQKELDAQKERLAQNRSLEDYALADTEEDRKIEQAGDAVAKAEEKLDDHLNNQPRQTPDEERNQKKEEYKDWDSRMKDLQKQQISANSELEAAKAEEGAARKALDDYIAAHGDSGGGDGYSGSDSSGEDNNSGSGSSGGSPDSHDGGQEVVRENTAQSREGQASGGSVSGNDGGSDGSGTAGGDSAGGDSVGGSDDGGSAGGGSGSGGNSDSGEASDNGGTPDGGEDNTGGGSGPAADPERERLEEALKVAEARRESAERRVKSIEEELAKGSVDTKTKPDYANEDSAWENWESTKKSLEDSVDSAKQNQENSVWDKLDAMLEAKRKVEDSTLAANPDLTLEMNQMEIAYRNEILQKYVQLQKADGQVFSEDNGIVTKIKISSGERVPDGASVVLADLDESFKFRTTLTREEKKYVDINDTVSLKLGNSGRTVEGQVAYLAESESTPGSYDAIVYLPPGEGAVGQRGTMTASSQSQSYPLTIPAKAVYTDNGISYVFVLRKQQGILGEELAASRVNVNVLDKNNKFASIEEGTIDADTEIIVDTTKALEEGAVVRYGNRKE